ncbi:MAG: exo-alpha-sialidase [Verrucomicrobiales bacterium]
MPVISAIRKTTCLALFSCGASVFALPVFDEQSVFVSGQDGYHTYRIPAIIRTPSGALLAFCEGRKNSSSDTGDIDLLVRRSTDNGNTWSPRQVVWSDGSNTCGNPAPVVAADGTIRLLSTWNLGSDNESMIVNGTSADTRRVFVLSSIDDGLTWSPATEITATAKQSGWTWYATGPGAGIRLERGIQTGRLVVACDHMRADTKAFGSHVIYSDDGGTTWHIGAVATSTATVRPNENLAVELVDSAPGSGSRLYFNARDHQGPHSRASTLSLDGGHTFIPAEFTDAPHFVTPVVQGGLARFRSIEAGDPHNRILFSCPNAGSRTRMSIWSSVDEAQTWSAPKLLNEGPSAYSDMTRLGDARMGLLFEKGNSSPYETITFVRFNEAWLDEPPPPAENPGAAFWNLEETPPGQNIPTNAGALKDIHPADNNLHLTTSASFPSTAGASAFGNGRAVSIKATGGLRILDSESFNRFDFGPNDSFTIEVVCRIPLGSTQTGALVAKDLATNSPSWWLRAENGKVRFLVSDDTSERILSSSANINTGQWHHVAAVRDATNPANKQLRLFVDGQISGALADSTVGSFANNNALWIGRYNAGTRQLTGDIDLVRITPSALEPAQFAARSTQYDADGDGIPDTFERGETGRLDVLGPEHRAGFAFGSVPVTAPMPSSRLTIEGGEIVIRRLQRDLPFWHDMRLFHSDDLRRWAPISPTSSVVEPLANGLFERTERLPFPSGENAASFYRHQLDQTP